MNEKEVRQAFAASAVLAAIIVAALIFSGDRNGLEQSGATIMPVPATVDTAGAQPWKQAAKKVEEDRGEPTGKQAKVDVPQQLRHYSDSRRFLAIQVAEWQQHRFETPHDFADLARLIRKGEMVELKPVSENYILYGVGGSAEGEPFTSYDAKDRKRFALYGEAELEQEYERIALARQTLDSEIAGLKQELGSVSEKDRQRRAAIQSEITKKEKLVKQEAERKEMLDAHYNGESGRELFAKYETIRTLASSFSGRTYDITNAHARKQMKVRMLSSLRPQALKVLEEIASSYRQKFDRPLAVTSLVRPDEYQYNLSKTNPNATRIATPPHSTGLAFDIYYKFMTAEEQAYVMAELARLKDEGRIEVLRENRDHYHVFAFIDGRRPDDRFVSGSLEKVSPSKAADTAHASAPTPKADSRKSSEKNDKREKKAKASKAKVSKAKGKRR